MANTIEELLNELQPGHGELFIEDGVAKAILFDAELDPIQMVFYREGGLELNTGNISYVPLSLENIERMGELSVEAVAWYEENETEDLEEEF